MSVKQVRAMDVDEVIGWIAYDQLEPMPNDWAMHGSLCSLIAQLAGNRNVKPSDFIPSVKEETKLTATDDVIRALLGGNFAKSDLQ
jgi:hypothetical protein